MHVPILLHITTDSSFFFFFMDTAEYYSDGAGSAPCEPVSIMGLRSYYDLRNSPSSTTFSPHLTAAVSRTYLHRVTRMQSLGGLTR